MRQRIRRSGAKDIKCTRPLSLRGRRGDQRSYVRVTIAQEGIARIFASDAFDHAWPADHF